MRINQSIHRYIYQTQAHETKSKFLLKEESEITSTGRENDKIDFSHITRKDMHDWIVSGMKDGTISADYCFIFTMLTVKIPVDIRDETRIEDDHKIYNYNDIVRKNIENARFLSDRVLLEKLESLMNKNGLPTFSKKINVFA